jgi:hypothetical protein
VTFFLSPQPISAIDNVVLRTFMRNALNPVPVALVGRRTELGARYYGARWLIFALVLYPRGLMGVASFCFTRLQSRPEKAEGQ